MTGRTYVPHLVGYPRIGPKRELKRALEGRWSERLSAEEFHRQIPELREAHLAEQVDLVGTATDDFFLYDAALETAIMCGFVPAWAKRDDPFDELTALTRGTPSHEAWEMTKWFDTNYHYVVPKLAGHVSSFHPLPWRTPQPGTTWVVLGPYSLVKLSQVTEDPYELARGCGAALWSWIEDHRRIDPSFEVQLDEPYLGLTLDEDSELLEAAYSDVPGNPKGLVSVQFGRPSGEALALLGDRGLAVQVPAVHLATYEGLLDSQPELLLSVLDGRSVWPDDPAPIHAALEGAVLGDRRVRLTTSTSLMFLPYTVKGEELPHPFQFAREKAATLRRWAESFSAGEVPSYEPVPVPTFPPIGAQVQRVPRADRRQAQTDLDLPKLPTTTTGSLPQTSEVRRLRVRLAKGELDPAGYEQAIDGLIREAVEWQEETGLDVLVHGEFERSDMVEYFAQKIDGFYPTKGGWVLSYGSRCTRPPILAAPPEIAEPLTVREWRVAQDASTKPVKGMLTGPVTITNWSFRPPGVPDDLLFWSVAQPIAREVGHLVEAGARIVQIDEPAVRERWPLPTADATELREIYSRGVRAALNKVFDAPAHVQMHTHMCYGDFGDIVPLWSDAGVDVASIEYSRSKDPSYIHGFYDLFSDGHLQIGPGTFDVHSPHSPGAATISDRLDYFLDFMDAEDVWVNPDCGLKTRTWEEISQQLSDMVKAAEAQRAELADR